MILELFRLAPVSAEPAIWGIRNSDSRYNREEGIPFTVAASWLSPESVEDVITGWSKQYSIRDLQEYFVALEVGELPNEEFVAAARSAFTDLARQFTDRIRALCWDEEQIRCLASVQERLNKMGPVRRALEAVGGR